MPEAAHAFPYFRMAQTGKYLVVGPSDLQWGVVVTSVGTQTIEPGQDYPPRDHPTRYLFSSTSGRILDEFQLVYIISGKGSFESRTLQHRTEVKAGDAMLLFPGEWHSYCPDKATGWVEFWIGFKGTIPDSWVSAGILGKDTPILHPGIHARLEQMYSQGLEYANSGASEYQKVLGSTALSIIGTALYFDRNNSFRDNEATALMEKAREIIISSCDTISAEGIAEAMGIGYSRFRKLFKDFYGIAPGQYILQIRIARAKELLTNTELQIQEIAWQTGFENPDYFSTVFLRMTGQKAKEYRKLTRQTGI